MSGFNSAIDTSSSLYPNNIFRCPQGQAPMLTSSNYPAWSKAMEFIFDAAYLWDIVQGIEKEPESDPRPTRSSSTITISDGNSDALELKIIEYRKRYKLAAARIYNSCTPSVQHYIVTKNPAKIWKDLREALSKPRSDQVLRTLEDKFFVETFHQYDSMASYVDKLLSYQEQPATTSRALTDDDIIHRLLSGLPPSYDTTVDVLACQVNKTLSHTINLLIQKEEKLAQRSRNSQPLIALGRFQRKKGQRWQNSGKPSHHHHHHQNSSNCVNKQRNCFYCLKTGHVQSDCHLRKRALIYRSKVKSNSSHA